MRIARHMDILREVLPAAGLDLADIGCGGGGVARALAAEGARVVGMDCSAAALAGARPAPGFSFAVALAEALPLAGASLDAALYFNSLHHVAVPLQPRALAEAARVLRPGGLLFVLEPVAEGAYFQLTRAIEDETQVRAAAIEALRQAAAGPELRQEAEIHYLNPVRFEDFDSFRDRSLMVDPERAAAFAADEAGLRASFQDLADCRDGGFHFHQPSRVNLLRRR